MIHSFSSSLYQRPSFSTSPFSLSACIPSLSSSFHLPSLALSFSSQLRLLRSLSPSSAPLKKRGMDSYLKREHKLSCYSIFVLSMLQAVRRRVTSLSLSLFLFALDTLFFSFPLFDPSARFLSFSFSHCSHPSFSLSRSLSFSMAMYMLVYFCVRQE